LKKNAGAVSYFTGILAKEFDGTLAYHLTDIDSFTTTMDDLKKKIADKIGTEANKIQPD